MSKPTEIPQIASELFEMSKEYLDQEVVAPLRHTGRYLGFSLGGGALFAIGWLLLAVSAVRLAQDLLPDTELWSVLAYVVAAVVLLGVAALLVWRASKAKGYQ